MTNVEALEKAIDTTVLASGGKLTPEQANKFIDFIVDESVIFKDIQFRRMKSPEAKLDFLDISRRIIRAAAEGTTPSELATISTSERSLSVKEVILPIEITYSFLEENIERDRVEDHIMKMFAKQFTNDLEDLAVNGDTQAQNTDSTQTHYYNVSAGELSFLQILDGWIQLILADDSKHVVDTSGKDWQTVFKEMLASLPRRYKVSRNALRFYVAPDVEESYRFSLVARQTSLGDQYLTADKTATFMGIPVVPVPAMPDGYALLTMPKNLAFGIMRDITIEKDRDILRRVRQYVITAKVGVQIVTPDAAVLAYPLS